MAGTGDDDEEGMITGINVTPLVDIVLVLLIIFMVTASFIASRSIPVDLPRAVTGSEVDAATFAVVIDRQGGYFVDGRPVARDDLEGEIRSRVAAAPGVQVIISADRAVDHGRVIDVIDLIRVCGIGRFAINVVPPEKGK